MPTHATHQPMGGRMLLAGLVGLSLLAGCREDGGEARAAAGAAERRRMLPAATEPAAEAEAALVTGLDDPAQAVRLTALRLLAERGAAAPLAAALRHRDPDLRRTALQALERLGACGIPVLALALGDADASVRLAAARLAIARLPAAEARTALGAVEDDPDPEVRDLVGVATWPFERDELLLRQREADLPIRCVQEIPLPLGGWRLAPDPANCGHRHGWYAPDFDDRAWPEVAIGRPWGEQGPNHLGFAWYRGRVALPERPQRFDAVELAFAGVDEAAWVWINGRYAGRHDLGAAGWNLPFQLAVTDLVRWGADNHIAVRVQNRARAGGIYKPATLLVLKAGVEP